MSSEDPSPGLLTLQDLTINKPTLTEENRSQARYKLEQLKCYQEWYQERPHRSALQNMIATLHYRLGDEDSATKVLEEARKTDPSNINILHDLSHIYDKDYRKDDAEEVEAKLKVLLDQIKSGEGQLLYARCLAGKGLAWVFDLHPETKGTTRLDNSISFYKMALNIAGSEVSPKEKEDWMYYLALGYVLQIPIKKSNEKNTVEFYIAHLEKAMECLKPNLLSEDLHRKSDAWCLFGNLICLRPPSLKAIPKVISTNEYRTYWRCPEECYRQSLEFNSENCITLNQLARFHYYDQNNLDKALEVLEQSLELRSDIGNMWAFHLRAQVLRVKFNKHHQRSGKGPQPDYSLLERAKDDLELCTQYNPYVLDMIHLAEVCHKLSLNTELAVTEKRKMQAKALQWCTKAENCQDGAQRPEVHQKRALILQDMGDPENAVKCFMQAIDCENPGTTYNGNFLYMFNGMLSRYHDAPEKPLHRVKELAYWLDGGLHKYAAAKIKVSEFVKKYPEELLSIAEVLSHSTTKRRLEVSKKLIGAFRDTRTTCDKEKLEEIAENVSQSMKSLPKPKSKSPTSPRMPPVFSKGKPPNLTLNTTRTPEKEPSAFHFHPHKPRSLPVESTGEVVSETQTKGGENRKDPYPSSSSTVSQEGQQELAGSPVQIYGRITAEKDSHNVIGGSTAASSKEKHSSDSKSELSSKAVNISAEGHNDPSTGQIFGCQCDLQQTPPMSYTTVSAGGYPIVTPSEDQPGKPSSLESRNSITFDSVLSTPSSDRSNVSINLKITPNSDSGLDECFELQAQFQTCELSDCNIAAVLRKAFEKSDLRLAEIGEPPEEPKHSDFTYDFFAVYDKNCPETSDWVCYHLRPQLEDGIDPLKGCIPQRDFKLGKAIIKNVADAVRDSAKILLIISDTFFNAPWCEEATTLAMEPEYKHKVIPIQLKYVTLPPYLKKLHCEDATQTINWSRIRKNLCDI